MQRQQQEGCEVPPAEKEMFSSLFEGSANHVSSSSSSSSRLGTTLQIPKPVECRGASHFVGLDNQGATCYLNSLIQAMYMTPELRSGLFNVDPKELGVQFLDDCLQQRSDAIRLGIIEPDEALLEQLREFGIEDNMSKRALVAVKNAGVMEAMDYIDHHEKELRAQIALAPIEDKKKKKKPRLIPLELQRLFTQMQLLNKRSLSTQELTTRGFQWQGMDGAVQHDAHELNRLLIEALEKSLKHTSGESLCEKLYKGLIVNQIKCLTCHNISERAEHFYDLNVQVIDCVDLSASLRQYCSAELLEKDSAYQCDICNAKRSALRSTVLRELPPVLTFSCNRFRIDRTTNWQREKVISRSSFPLVLDMSRFVEGSKGTAESVFTGEKERTFLGSLKGSMLWVDEVTHCAKVLAAKFVDKYGAGAVYDSLSDAEKNDVAKDLSGSLELEMQNNYGDINIRRGNDGMNSSGSGSDERNKTDNMYQLFAVIMHKGSAHSGHYFAYIRDSLQEGIWELPDSHYSDVADIRELKRERRKKELKDAELHASRLPDSKVCDSAPHSLAGTGTDGGINSIHSAASLSNTGAYDAFAVHIPPPTYVTEAPPNLQYVHTSTGLLYIDESSVVGVISSIVMRAKSEQREREKKIVEKAKLKAELKVKANETKLRGMLNISTPSPNPPSSLAFHVPVVEIKIIEDPTVNISNINDLISLRLGRGSWNSLYEREHGQIDKFVGSHSEVFVHDCDTGLLSLKDYGRINWVCAEVMLAAYNEEIFIGYERALAAAHSAAVAGDARTADTRTKQMNDLSLSDPISQRAETDQKQGQSDITTAAHSMNCDNDAALALALQESLNLSYYPQSGSDTDSLNHTNTHTSDMSSYGPDARFGSRQNVSHTGNDDEWLTATQKKKGGKGKSKGGNEIDIRNRMMGDVTRNEGGDVKDVEKEEGHESDGAVELADEFLFAEKRLAEDLLSRHHGRYFEFNDTDVTAMSLGALEKAFEGKNSAYILVYRRIEEGKDVIAVADEKGEKGKKGKRSAKGEADLKMEGRVAESILITSPLEPLIDVKGNLPAVAISQTVKSIECKKSLCMGEPPSYWSEKVLMENKDIDDIRMKYNAMTHTAKVRFFCPCHVEFTDPLLVHKTGSRTQRGEKLNTVGTSSSYKANMDEVGNESENENCIELTLDLRMTVSDVKKAILEVCADRLVDLDLAEDLGNAGIINRSTSSNRSKSNNVGDISHGKNSGISNRKNNSARNGQDSSSSSSSGIKTTGSHTNNIDSIMNNNESEIGGGDTKDNCTTHSTTHIQLSTLNPFGTGFHPDMPLRPDAILGDVIGKASTMLIWNGRTIGGSTIQSGLLGIPIKLTVQLLELASNSIAVDEAMAVSSWTVDSINSIYLSRQRSQVESAPSGARPQSQKNLINLPPLHQVRTLDLWLSSSMSLTAACQTAARKLGLDPSRTCVHMLTKEGSSPQGPFASKKSQLPVRTFSAGKERLAAVLCWFGSATITHTARKVQELDSQVVGSIDARELIVEKSDGRGIYSLSLAEMEAERRNNSLCLTVDLDFNMTTTAFSAAATADSATTISKGNGSSGSNTSDAGEVTYTQSQPSDSDNIVMIDKGKKGDGDGVALDAHELSCGNSLQLDISRDCSLLYLKIKALWDLHKFEPLISDREIGRSDINDVPPTGDTDIDTSSRSKNLSDRRTDETNRILKLIHTTRLRLGDCRGVCVFDDEALTLHQAEVKDGATLCIESGVRTLCDMIRIRVCLVTGNDTTLKSNPKRPGLRGLCVDCDVLPSCTIRALRDLAGVLLMNLTPHWCDPLPTPIANVPTSDVHPDGADVESEMGIGADFQTVTSKRVKDSRPPPAPVPSPAAPKGPGRGRGQGGRGGRGSRNNSATNSSSFSFAALASSAATVTQPAASLPPCVSDMKHFKGKEVQFDPIHGLVMRRQPTTAVATTKPTAPSAAPATSPSSSSSSADPQIESSLSAAITSTCSGGELEWRLRRTNAFEECGDLLDETEVPSSAHGNGHGMKDRRVQFNSDNIHGGAADGSAPSSSSSSSYFSGSTGGLKHKSIWDVKAAESRGDGGEKELITVEGAGLRGGDLLLLEEGPLPLKGMTKLTVYLWLRNLSSLAIATDSDSNKDITASDPVPSAPLSDLQHTEKSLSSGPVHEVKHEKCRKNQKQDVPPSPSKHGQGGEQPSVSSITSDGQTARGKNVVHRQTKNKRAAVDMNNENAKPVSQQTATANADVTKILSVPVLTLVNNSELIVDPGSENTKNASAENAPQNNTDLGNAKIEMEKTEMEIERQRQKQKQLNPLELALLNRSKHLLPLFVSLPIQLPEESSLLDLQRTVYEALQGVSVCAALKAVIPSWAEPASVDHFVIRALRPDLLPSQCYWTSDPPSSTTSTSLLGIGSGSKIDKNTTANSSKMTLKKLNLIGEKKVVLELLEDRQQRVRPQTAGACRVWAQKLQNPENSIEGESVMTPDWPPIELTVSCGVSPSVAHLRRTICNGLPGLSPDKAILYKYSLQSCSWFEMKPGMRVEGKGKAVSLKRVENVLDPPYSLVEGDLICAFEVPTQAMMEAALSESLEKKRRMQDENADSAGSGKEVHTSDEGKMQGTEIFVPSSSSFSSSTAYPVSAAGAAADDASALRQIPPSAVVVASPLSMIMTSVSRAEDKHIKSVRQQERIDKKHGGATFRPMRRTKEIMLSLGGDLDFSDDSNSDEYT